MPISLEDYQALYGAVANSPVPEGPRRQYGWGDRFGAAVDSAQAGLLGIGEAMGMDSLADARRRNQYEAEYVRRSAIRDTGAPERLSDIDSLGSLGKGVAGLLVDSGPQLLATTAAAIGTSGIGLGLSTAGRLATGAAVGAPFNLGDILQNQREEAGKTDLLSAAALTVPYTAADMFGLEGAISRGKFFKSGIGYLDNMQGVRGLAARGTVNTGINALAEGTGETIQEFANQAGRIAVNPNQTMFNPDANERYTESFFGGALLGGAVSAPFSMGRSEGYIKKPGEVTPPQQVQQADLLRPEFGLQSYGPSEGPQYLSPDQLIERDQALRANEADWTHVPGPNGQQVFAPQFPLGYQATRMPQAGLMSGVYMDVNGQPVELTTDELRNNQMPYMPLSGAQLAMEKANNLPGGFGQVNQYGEPIDFTPGVGEQGSLFADPAPTTGTRRGLVTEMSPLQQRIDRNLGIGGQRVAKGDYVNQFTSAANAPTGQMLTGAGTNNNLERPETALEAVQRSAGILEQERALEEQRKQEEAKKAANKTRAKDLTGKGTDKAAETVAMLDKALSDRQISTQEHTDAINAIATATTPRKIQDAYKAAKSLVEGKTGAATTKTAPANAAATAASQAPANTTATASAPVATGQKPATATQPSGAPSAPAAPAPVTTTRKKATAVEKNLAGKTALTGGSIDFSLLKQHLEPLDPRLHHAVRLSLGIDKDGHKLDKALTDGAAAAKAGLGENSGGRVSEARNALGITKDVRYRFTASKAEADERAEGDIDVAEVEDAVSGDRTKALSDETTSKEEGDLSFSDVGIGVVSGVGKSQGNIDAPGRGKIVEQDWYKPVLEKGLANLKPVELGIVAYHAMKYANNVTPENKAALQAIMKEVRELDKSEQADFQRGMDKAEEGAMQDAKVEVKKEEDADGAPDEIEKSRKADGPVAVSIQTDNGTLEIKDARAAVDKLQDTIDRFRSLLACLGGS